MYTHKKLCIEVLKDEDTTMYWLQRKRLLRSSLNCRKCGSSCRIVPRKGSYAWRCPRKGCQAIVSYSFFSGSHLALNEIVDLTYWWSRRTPVGTAILETGHSSRTVVDWYNFHRDVCAQYFIDHPVQIGGPGKVVENRNLEIPSRKIPRRPLGVWWRISGCFHG